MSKLSFLNFFLKLFTGNAPIPTLPENIFLIATYFFPQVNVEVICMLPSGHYFLTWRDDDFGNKGWHIPGGIIRPNETLMSRVLKVVRSELPFLDKVTYPIDIVGYSEVFCNPPSIRSHFISLVTVLRIGYAVDIPSQLLTSIIKTNKIPNNLIQNHKRYEPLLLNLSQSHDLHFRKY